MKRTYNFLHEYLLQLKFRYGVNSIFGVPGHYSIASFNEPMEEIKNLNFVNCVTELDSAFAASGYARVNGMGVSVNCYGIGVATGLAHVNAFANNLPLVNIQIGTSVDHMKRSQKNGITLHHYINSYDYEYCSRVFEPISIDSVEIREKDLCEEGFHRLLEKTELAYRNKLPIYVSFPSGKVDFESSMSDLSQIAVDAPSGYEDLEDDMIDEIISQFEESEKPVLILGALGVAHRVSSHIEVISSQCNIPMLSLWDSKGGVSEYHENYEGVHFYGNTPFEDFVMDSDFCLIVGNMDGEISMIDGTLKLPPNTITWNPQHNNYIGNLEKLTSRMDHLKFSKRSSSSEDCEEFPIKRDSSSNLSDNFVDPTLVYQLINEVCEEYEESTDFFHVLDIGDVSFGSTVDCLRTRRDSMMHSGNFCALGTAVAPAHGVKMALEDRENEKDNIVISVAGDGGFHMSSTAVSGMLHNDAKGVIIVVLDNIGYTTTFTFSGQGEYNDIPFWDISKLNEVYGNEGFMTHKCFTGEEFLEALSQSVEFGQDGVSLIHVITPKRSVSDGMRKYASS